VPVPKGLASNVEWAVQPNFYLGGKTSFEKKTGVMRRGKTNTVLLNKTADQSPPERHTQEEGGSAGVDEGKQRVISIE